MIEAIGGSTSRGGAVNFYEARRRDVSRRVDGLYFLVPKLYLGTTMNTRFSVGSRNSGAGLCARLLPSLPAGSEACSTNLKTP
jgi:hypothetical protein